MTRPASPVRFSAPLGLRVRLTTTACIALCPVLAVVVFALHHRGIIPADARWPALLAPVAILAVLIPVILTAWVRGFRVEAGTLVVERVFRTVRLPLAGLTSAALESDALRGAIKLFGNDGAGAITGWFASKRLGRFRAFVTDLDNAVVLRWADRTIVVSPDRPASFVSAIRIQAGLAR